MNERPLRHSYTGHERTLEETAAILGVSRMTVLNIERRALAKIKRIFLERWGVETLGELL